MIEKLEKTLLWTYVISDLNGEEILGMSCERELLKTNQTEFRVEKVIKRTVKPYVKCKAYNNLFNSWIDKKDIDELDTHKLKTAPVDLDRLSHVVKYDVFKKTSYGRF